MSVDIIKVSIKKALSDKKFLFLVCSLVFAGIVYLLIISLNIHSSDVTVYNRYTAAGDAHFYKDNWRYYINFLVFGLIVVIFHCAAAIKLYNLERKSSAIFMIWSGVGILILAIFYVFFVMSLGRTI